MEALLIATIGYLVIGGSFSFGQLIAVEIGKYEVWETRERLFSALALGTSTFLLALVFVTLPGLPTGLFPIILFSAVILEKAFVHELNKSMPERFQPSEEELREKYREVFKVDLSDVKAVLEDEFIQKLGFEKKASTRAGVSFLDGEDEVEEGEDLGEAIEDFMTREKDEVRKGEDLGEAIEGFMEREKKRKGGKGKK